MRIELFDFELPKASIATEPARPRESARLLCVNPDAFIDFNISDLPCKLNSGDVLVVNDTRVMPARLFALKDAARIEILLHKYLGEGCWQCFAKPGKKLKVGDHFSFLIPSETSIRKRQGSPLYEGDALEAQVLEKLPSGEVKLLFNSDGDVFKALLPIYGAPPLPPYIERPEGATKQDWQDYQTCYAAHDGSIAAPTAGLHFTPALMAALEAKGVTIERVTLHVGAGTFQPVKVDDTSAHVMHSEWGEITEATAARLNSVKRSGGRIVAVGTTSLRLLESAANEAGMLHPFRRETDIFITPGYKFRFVDCLMTNFHLPRSTLFMLVCAFAGMERMHAAYRHAIASGYRFYSYGDACFLERE